MNNPTHTPQRMPTLSEQINNALELGFVENFSVDGKFLVVAGKHDGYSPEQTKISNYFRFEGDSNPEDTSILYLIETEDGKRGTLTDAYGAYADAKISSFIHDVEDIQKKAKP